MSWPRRLAIPGRLRQHRQGHLSARRMPLILKALITSAVAKQAALIRRIFRCWFHFRSLVCAFIVETNGPHAPGQLFELFSLNDTRPGKSNVPVAHPQRKRKLLVPDAAAVHNVPWEHSI